MKNDFKPYECQFSIEERRRITAQMIKIFRENKGYSQKQVANLLGISQPSYSSYENGQTNIPTEMLIRISFLFEVPLDELVQKNRFYRTKDDAIKIAKGLKQQLQEYEEEIIKKYKDNPAILKLLNATKEMVEAIEQTSNDEMAIKQVESTLDK